MRWRALPGGLALAVTLQVAQAGQSPPQVVLVQPSAAEVPANLLRLSIVFAAPVEGAVLPRIALTHADGSAVQEPFLPQELWSPDGKILTLLLHPGRVKTGLIAGRAMGAHRTSGGGGDPHPRRTPDQTVAGRAQGCQRPDPVGMEAVHRASGLATASRRRAGWADRWSRRRRPGHRGRQRQSRGWPRPAAQWRSDLDVYAAPGLAGG